MKAVSSGGIRGGFSYVGNGAKKVYSSFKSYAAERTSEIRATIHKEMCTTNNRISSLLGKVDWSAVKKVVAGGVILGGLAAATVLTGGAAAVIAGGALSGALIGGGTGAVLGGISSAASGEGFISGAADGFLWGTIGGAVSGGVGAATGSLASSSVSSIMKNPLAKSALENAADTAVGTVDELAHGRDVTLGSIAMDFGTGMVSSNIDLKKASHTTSVIEDTPKHSVKPDFIVGTNGTTVSKEVYDMSNAEFVQEVANISNKKVNEELTEEGKSIYGHVAGSKKHGEAYRIANDYQEFVDDRGLKLEQPYKGHKSRKTNKKGGTRLDVYDTNDGQVYDYKFVKNPGKGLSNRQKNKIIHEGPKGLTENKIHEVNPK